MNPKLSPENHGNLHQKKALQQTTTHEILKFNKFMQSNPRSTRSTASTANVSLRSSGKSSAELAITLPWLPLQANRQFIWLIWLAHGIPWCPMVSHLAQFQNDPRWPTLGTERCGFAGHGAGFLTWSRSWWACRWRDLTRKIARLDRSVSLWALGGGSNLTLNIPVDFDLFLSKFSDEAMPMNTNLQTK